MRVAANMSSSVDYRVITITDAPGMEKREVRLEKSETEMHNNSTQDGKENRANIHSINRRLEKQDEENVPF